MFIVQELPNTQVAIIGAGVPIASEDRLDFHLLYTGPLHSPKV
jgi:hypothetical protein